MVRGIPLADLVGYLEPIEAIHTDYLIPAIHWEMKRSYWSSGPAEERATGGVSTHRNVPEAEQPFLA
jgi:hypothetical protein